MQSCRTSSGDSTHKKARCADYETVEDLGVEGLFRTDAANAKPPVFTAETKKLSFSDWNFKFRAYAGHQSSEMLTAMNNIQHHRDPLDMATYTEEQRRMAMILYFHLTMYTEGTPLGS